MQLAPLRNDKQRITFLRVLNSQALQDETDGMALLPAVLAERARSLEGSFREGLDTARKTLSRRRVAVAAKRKAVETFERGYLLSLMRESNGNVTRAARQAGTERRALGKLLKKHGIDTSVFQRDDTDVVA